MNWGMKNRLSRIIDPKTGHCVMLAVDHGYFQGPTKCLEKPGETIKPILPYCDALFVTRGVLRSSVDPAIDKPVILRVSGGTSIRSMPNAKGMSPAARSKNSVRVPPGQTTTTLIPLPYRASKAARSLTTTAR